MIKVLICDDHVIVREGLKQIVAEEKDISIVGEAATGEELLRMLITTGPDVILLDIAMDGMGGVETLKELKQRSPEIAVLVLSMYPEDQYAVRVLRSGASGYLTKKSAPEELVEAIRAVAGGRKRYITESVSEQLVSSLKIDSEKLPHELLSDREYQVLIKLAEGLKMSKIASDLHISVKTVSTYKSRIFEKMNLNKSTDIVRYALEHGLVS